MDRFTASLQRLMTTLTAGAAGIAGLALSVDPAALYQFSRALRDTTAALGLTLTPVLQKLTQIIKAVGDAIYSLGPNAQKMVQALATAAVATLALTAAVAIYEAVATGGLSSVLTLIGGVAAGGAILGTSMEKVQEAFARVGDFIGVLADAFAPLFASLVELMSGAMSAIAEALSPLASMLIATLIPIFDTLKTAVEPIIKAIGPLIQLLGAALAPTLTQMAIAFQVVIAIVGQSLALFAGYLEALGPVIDQVGGFLRQLMGLVQDTFSEILTQATAVMRLVVDIIQGFLKPLVEALAPVLATVFPALLRVVQTLAGVLTGLAHAFSAAAAAFVNTVLVPILQDLGRGFGEIAQILGDSLLVHLDTLRDAFQEIGTAIVGLVKVVLDLLTMKPVMEFISLVFRGIVFLVIGLIKVFVIFATTITELVTILVRAVTWIVKMINALAGFEAIKGPELRTLAPIPKGARNDSFGLAREVGTGSLEGITQQFLLDALRSSLARKSPAEETNEHLKELNKNVVDIKNKVGKDSADINKANMDAARGNAAALDDRAEVTKVVGRAWLGK